MPFLQAISLFPYNNWWRLGGKAELKNYLGGICTLLIFVLVAIIFGFKLAEVFNRTKMSVSQTFQLQNFVSNYTFTTYQNDSSLNPFMAAVATTPFYMATKGNLTSSDFIISGSKQTHYSKDNSSSEVFALQRCTVEHFSKLPNIAQIYEKRGMSNWLCLPLNQNYSFGGDEIVSNNSKIIITILCRTAACRTENYPIAFNYYLLQNQVNPYSQSNLIATFISQQAVLFSSSEVYIHTVQLDLNNLITDNSLLPQTDQSQINVYSFNQNIPTFQFAYSQRMVMINLQRSRVTNTYLRTYQKLLDAISYIGGIFQSILALFIFIQIFNASYFEMKFAAKYFKCKQARNFYFGKFLKQVFYQALHNTKYQPEWGDAQVRRKIKEAVVNLQDIVYINRRIEFLERATSILFEKHQLKGLSLLHNKTDMDVVKDYKHQQFRDRLIYFFQRHSVPEMQQHHTHKIEGINQDKVINQNNRPQMEHKELNKTKQQCQAKTQKNTQKKIDGKINYQVAETKVDGLRSSQLILKEQIRDSVNVERYSKRQLIFDEIQEKYLLEYNNPESDNLLIQDIEDNLKKLVQQAQDPLGDKRSKIIYQKIDTQLRNQLKAAIIQFKGKLIPLEAQKMEEKT